MCEAATTNDSVPILWGEIDVNIPHSAENLWKPFHEYQENNQEKNLVYQSFSENSFECEMKKYGLCYDPIGKHFIQLRECYYELKELLCKAETKREENKSSSKGYRNKAKKTKLPPFSIPPFPSLSGDSFEASKKNNSKRISRVLINENQVKEQIAHFVKHVLAENGYCVKKLQSDSCLIKCLVNVTDEFLRGFIHRLTFHKSSEIFSNTSDLWGPLETTLWEIKFGGINGLYKCSCEKLEKHQVLLQECEDMLERYNKLRN